MAMSNDKTMREALEEGRDLFIDYACEGNENTPLEPLRSWLDKSAAALCATPPEGGRILFDPSDHTSPSLPAKEERDLRCTGHVVGETWSDCPQPAAQNAEEGPCSQMNRDLLWDAAHYQKALEVVRMCRDALDMYAFYRKGAHEKLLSALAAAEAILKKVSGK
jgi:hypothetical protein